MSNVLEDIMPQQTDSQLIARAQAGDVEAFAELALRFQNEVYATLLTLTRNPQDADDLTQEAFLQAFRALNGFKQESGFYTWLYRIAHIISGKPFFRKRVEAPPAV